MTESWKDIPGWEGRYQASSTGRVRSVDRTVETRSGPRSYKGQVLTTRLNDHGYLVVGLSGPGHRGAVYRVHRLVCAAFHGAAPEGERSDVRHLNGNRVDNRAENLAWGTRSENMYDKREHGTDHNANRETCKRGHLLREPNLTPSIGKMGARRRWRGCLACSRALSYVKYPPNRNLDVQKISDGYYADLLDGVPSLTYTRNLDIGQ